MNDKIGRCGAGGGSAHLNSLRGWCEEQGVLFKVLILVMIVVMLWLWFWLCLWLWSWWCQVLRMSVSVVRVSMEVYIVWTANWSDTLKWLSYLNLGYFVWCLSKPNTLLKFAWFVIAFVQVEHGGEEHKKTFYVIMVFLFYKSWTRWWIARTGRKTWPPRWSSLTQCAGRLLVFVLGRCW